MKKKTRIVSGIQPSGRIHVGNYLGAIKNFVELQNSGSYDCFYFIADLHSLSENYDPKQKRTDIYDLLATLLALGIDPKKSTLFLQSQITGHTELAWLFSTVLPVSELERMTQYKDKASRQKSNINTALLTYPVLQAADVLLYEGEKVPVGKDQEQHVELIRVIAKKMNNAFGTNFPESTPLFTHAPKIMSLRDPSKKMSKSLGDAHVLNVFASLEETKKKLSRAVTGTDLSSKESAPFVELYRQFVTKKPSGKFSEMKAELTDAINDYFADARTSYNSLLQDTRALDKVLEQGRAKAQPIASKNLEKIKQHMGLI